MKVCHASQARTAESTVEWEIKRMVSEILTESSINFRVINFSSLFIVVNQMRPRKYLKKRFKWSGKELLWVSSPRYKFFEGRRSRLVIIPLCGVKGKQLHATSFELNKNLRRIYLNS